MIIIVNYYFFFFFPQKYFEAIGEIELEPELHVDNIEKSWTRLMMAHQEKDQAIQEEIKR